MHTCMHADIYLSGKKNAQSPTETDTDTDLDVGADARLVLPHRHGTRPAQRLYHQGGVPRQGRHLGELLFGGGGLWKRVKGNG